MSLKDDYLIPFYGLKEGTYDYEFEAGDDFFAFFDNPEFKKGDLIIQLTLNRRSQFLDLHFKIHGSIQVNCDFCLEEFRHNIDTENELIVRFGESFEEVSDTVVLIPREETRFNVAQYIFEFAVLSLPMQKIHPLKTDGSSGCNEEMIRKLEKLKPGEKEEKTDPRWDALKNFKSKD